ncbi:YHYH domain-containing protein [Candidatus Falkowbacteria bacterium]|nr:YHYH domain-containing protein [Candidatus Falkowbacteria bacterium]
MKLATLILTIALFLPLTVSAHPGRTDSSGCHTCRTNCSSWGLSYGEYHCHRAKTTAPQPVEPVRSHRVEDGIGYTTPAPDYKTPEPDVDSDIDDDILNTVAVQKLAEEAGDDDSESGWIIFWIFVAGGIGYAAAKARKK